MAIGFMPSDEDTDARYERLNRILLELYDVVYNLVHRSPSNVDSNNRTSGEVHSSGSQQNTRVRPASDSSAPQLPDILCDASPPRRRISSQRSAPSSPSCSVQHLCRTFSDFYDRNLHDSSNPMDDEVFFASPPSQSQRIPSAAPQPRQRRRRRRSNSLKEKKTNKSVKSEDVPDIGCWDEKQTNLEDYQKLTNVDQDTVDSPQSQDVEKVTEPDTSLISTLLTTGLGGSLWTAFVIVVGWRLLANNR